jgi:hypothetical protein
MEGEREFRKTAIYIYVAQGTKQQNVTTGLCCTNEGQAPRSIAWMVLLRNICRTNINTEEF